MAESIISKLTFLLSNRFLSSTSSSTSTRLNPSQCMVIRSSICDYSPLKNSGSKQQIILSRSRSQHKVIQSQEEANKKIRYASPRQHFGVGRETDEDTLNKLGGDCRRRKFFVSLILVAATSTLPMTNISTNIMAAAQENQLQQSLTIDRYTDANEGFTLLKPSSWMKVEKAGATVLFEDTNKKNNLGIVVSPVRLSSLGEFGSPEFVADKLIQAEKRKESTKNAKVIGVAERLGHGGLQVYEFEYTLDSTRGGVKRIFSAAFVASKKLYLLNIAYADPPESPIDTSSKMILEQVLHSFDTSAADETM